MANLANIDQLIQSGLGNVKKLAYYRIILSDPESGVKNMVYRDLTIDLCKKLFGYAINDPIIFNRLRQLLLQRNEGRDTRIGTDAYRDLAVKLTPGQTVKIIKKAAKKK
jgi:hypothetical protein